MPNDVTIKLLNPRVPILSKLNFVKMIKDHTGLGLKDSKDLCDWLHDSPGNRIDITVNDYELFEKDISNFDEWVEISGGVIFRRNMKILMIGIGNKSDYVDAISEVLKKDVSKINILLERFDQDELFNILKEVVNLEEIR